MFQLRDFFLILISVFFHSYSGFTSRSVVFVFFLQGFSPWSHNFSCCILYNIYVYIYYIKTVIVTVFIPCTKNLLQTHFSHLKTPVQCVGSRTIRPSLSSPGKASPKLVCARGQPRTQTRIVHRINKVIFVSEWDQPFVGHSAVGIILTFRSCKLTDSFVCIFYFRFYLSNSA